MSVYPWSAQNRSKLMSRVADFRLNIQPTDLMERYETFLWTQTIRSGEISLQTPRLLLGVDLIRPIDILNARY
jgi:hypothetical protein